MTFRNECHGNALEACYVIAEGPIDSQAATRLDAMLENGVEAFKVLLNSSGGDLSAGIAMGRVIRKHDLQTRIGIYREMDSPTPGECLSACAYAFLGGTQRFVQDGSRIGFHQFALGQSPMLEGTGGLIVGQKLSASVIAYMVEMGVDARLFTVATETNFDDMYFPERADRLTYDVETAVGFDHFTMEPYGNGVVAASKRRGPTHAYDRVDHLTAYCRNGQARVLLTVRDDIAFVPDPANAISTIGTTEKTDPRHDDWTMIDVPPDNVRAWTNSEGGYIEMAFDRRSLALSDRTTGFQAVLGASRAAGGTYRAVVTLNAMDREMLRTAFRLCI